MTQVPLNRFDAVTLNGSGNGTAKVGPVNAREVWSPAIASVRTNQAAVTNEASCKIYIGPDTSPPNFVDGTLSGSTGDSTDSVAGQQVRCGQYVFAVWAGGDPGAQAFLNVTGTSQVG